MLSYRHAFHAGNHADVLKHITLVLTLEYYKTKDKPFVYIDTHAGSGLYQLNDHAQRNREFSSGIQTLWQATQLPDSLQPYLALIKQINPNAVLKQYPGSPWLAAQCLRAQDSLRLFELHPNDFLTLEKLFANDKSTQVRKQDGLQGLIGLVPPLQRRAVVLIDPSYEIKSDYTAVIETLAKAHKRFATGTYLLWYPVVERQRVTQMLKAIVKAAIPNVLQLEFCPTADSVGLGMTGSGMLVINPPWKLAQQMQVILPHLAKHMANNRGHFSVQQITPEKL